MNIICRWHIVCKASFITTAKTLFKLTVSKEYPKVGNTRSCKILVDAKNNMDLIGQKFVTTSIS